jgi:hypothetical protein
MPDAPAGEDIEAWLAHASAGRHEAAWRRLVEDNPLAAIHGRVCYHPCETVCNRANLDSAVAIHSVERFLGDLARERGWKFQPPSVRTGQRILVVGAGPSGLSAAYHLARLGHEVEIRDAGAVPGGMMRYGIPSYRLPRHVLDDELNRIAAMGVRLTFDHRVDDLAAERDVGGFAGKTVPKKGLALQAIVYGSVYVAKIAMAPIHNRLFRPAFREAEAYDGPSLVIAYSQCTAHGIDMRLGMDQQYRAVASGHWTLLRYDPVLRGAGKSPFLLDSHRPRIPLADHVYRELRYRSLANYDPVEGERLLGLAERSIELRWNVYEEMASRCPETLPPRRSQGMLMELSTRYLGLDLRNPLVRRRPRCRRPSTVSGASPMPESVRWCSIRFSRSNCAAKPRRIRALPSLAPRASPSRCRTSRRRPTTTTARAGTWACSNGRPPRSRFR